MWTPGSVYTLNALNSVHRLPASKSVSQLLAGHYMDIPQGVRLAFSVAVRRKTPAPGAVDLTYIIFSNNTRLGGKRHRLAGNETVSFSSEMTTQETLHNVELRLQADSVEGQAELIEVISAQIRVL